MWYEHGTQESALKVVGMCTYLLCAVEFRLELLHLMPASLCKYFQLLLQAFHPLLQELLLLLQTSIGIE